MVNNLLWFCFFAAMCCFTSQAKAQEKQVFRVGVEAIDYYPIFDFSNETGDRPSFTQELLTHFFETHDYAYKLVPLPIKRFDRWYIEDGIDFKFPDNKRWREPGEFVDSITFSDPIFELTAGTYTLAKNQQKKREEVDQLVTILGFYPTLWLDRVSAGKTKLMEARTPLSVVKHVLRENAVATNIDRNVINYNLRLLGENTSTVVLNKNMPHETYTYHFSSIRYPEVVAQFNQFLINNKDYIEQLKQKYNIVKD